jgi:hypothetical protein
VEKKVQGCFAGPRAADAVPEGPQERLRLLQHFDGDPGRKNCLKSPDQMPEGEALLTKKMICNDCSQN